LGRPQTGSFFSSSLFPMLTEKKQLETVRKTSGTQLATRDTYRRDWVRRLATRPAGGRSTVGGGVSMRKRPPWPTLIILNEFKKRLSWREEKNDYTLRLMGTKEGRGRHLFVCFILREGSENEGAGDCRKKRLPEQYV